MLTYCYWLVGVAALFLDWCATPRTVATAPSRRAPVARWRGVTLAAEHRCAPYRSDEYAYPQAVEDDIIQRLGGLFSPYMGEVFDSKGDTDIEHVAVAPFLFRKTRHTWDTTKNFSPFHCKTSPSPLTTTRRGQGQAPQPRFSLALLASTSVPNRTRQSTLNFHRGSLRYARASVLPLKSDSPLRAGLSF